MDQKNNTYIVISPRSIAHFTLIPLALYFLWYIRDLLFSLLIAFILMSALRPAAAYLVRKQVPRGLAVGLVYLGFVLVFIALVSIIIPPIVTETSSLIRNLPIIIQQALPQNTAIADLSQWTQFLPNATNIFGFITGVFSNTLFVLTTFFFSLYFLLEENLFDRFLHKYIHKSLADKIVSALITAEKRMTSWFWGEIALMTVVGVLTYLGLTIIGIRYALPLAVLAGLLEVVPNVGPVISAIPAILLGFGYSYFSGFSALALYIIVQQLENHLIVPLIMRKAVGINPVITLLALLIGGRVGGVLGLLLAIPIILFFETVIGEFFDLPKSSKPL